MNVYNNEKNLISYNSAEKWASQGALTWGWMMCCLSQLGDFTHGQRNCSMLVDSLWLLFCFFLISLSTADLLTFSLWRSDKVRVMGRPEGFIYSGYTGDGKAMGKDAFNQNEGTITKFIV